MAGITLFHPRAIDHLALGEGKDADGTISGCHCSHYFLLQYGKSTHFLETKSMHFTPSYKRIKKTPSIYRVTYLDKGFDDAEQNFKTLYDPGWKTAEELKSWASEAFENYKMMSDYSHRRQSRDKGPWYWFGEVKVEDSNVPDYKGERFNYHYLLKFCGYWIITENQDRVTTFWPAQIRGLRRWRP